jgi:hypothetical protein
LIRSSSFINSSSICKRPAVDDHGRNAETFRFRYAVSRDRDRVVRRLGVNRKVDLFAERLKLRDRRGAIHVGGDEEGPAALLLEA